MDDLRELVEGVTPDQQSSLIDTSQIQRRVLTPLPTNLTASSGSIQAKSSPSFMTVEQLTSLYQGQKPGQSQSSPAGSSIYHASMVRVQAADLVEHHSSMPSTPASITASSKASASSLDIDPLSQVGIDADMVSSGLGPLHRLVHNQATAKSSVYGNITETVVNHEDLEDTDDDDDKPYIVRFKDGSSASEEDHHTSPRSNIANPVQSEQSDSTPRPACIATHEASAFNLPHPMPRSEYTRTSTIRGQSESDSASTPSNDRYEQANGVMNDPLRAPRNIVRQTFREVYPNNSQLDQEDPETEHGTSDEAYLADTDATGDVVNTPASLTAKDTHGTDSFFEHLRKLHQQDVARDELLMSLHQEIQALRAALKVKETAAANISMRGSDVLGSSRAEAAERSLMEARDEMQRKPFVSVIVDGEGYDFHEDLLQCGYAGGLEAAHRLAQELQNFLQKFIDGTSWDILTHVYLNVGGVIAKSIAAACEVTETSIRDFMCGLTQSEYGPLFNIVDVGSDRAVMHRKVEGLFHLCVSNVHCRRVFFGGCHDSAYALVLGAYTSNPIIGSRITLLSCGDDDEYYDSLQYGKIELPHVFRPVTFSTPRSSVANNENTALFIPKRSNSMGQSTPSAGVPTPSTSQDEGALHPDAIESWQNAANGNPGTSVFPPRNPAVKPKKNASPPPIFHNIDRQRVDPPLEEIDYETKESMLDRMEERHFCSFYHLQGNCFARTRGQTCKYTHGTALNNQELIVLKNHARRIPCEFGSSCHKANCPSGHICPDQPNCKKGNKCRLSRFHGVDKTIVGVYHPPKSNKGSSGSN